MAKAKPQERVDHILAYLDKMRQLAEQLHDRNGVGDYEHAWLIVMQRFYGRYRPVRFPRITSGYFRVTPSKPKTTEQALIAKAPLRKVRKRVPKFWRDRHQRHAYTSWTEHLECGHRLTDVMYADGEKQAKRRKCRACVPPAKTRVLKFPREVAI